MITVAGLTPSLDLTYPVGRLVLGEITRVPEVVRCAGGKSLNMARAAATAGADCRVVAVLGGPTGSALAEMLRGEGLGVDVVESPAETRICVSIAAADSGLLTEVYQEAAPIPEPVLQRFRTTLTEALAGTAGWLAVSGRAPAGSAGIVAELVGLGRDAGVEVAVDSSAEALGPAIEARPSLVKINRYEAADRLGVDPVTADLLAMATALRAQSGATVVLTDSTAGALGVDGEQAVHATAPGVRGRYPVGSGDSFLGGLLAAYERGVDLADALRTATACGVANALTPGQGHFAWSTVTEIAPRVELRHLA